MQRIRGSTRMRYINLLLFTYLLTYLVFYSNFVLKIFDFKNAVTLKTGLGVRQGHRKCHNMIKHV